jgi:hypothetical protein
MRAVLVAQPAADRAQDAARQREARRQQRRGADVEAELADVVLHHPQAQGDVAAEDDRVVLAVLDDGRILQGVQLVGEADVARHEVRRVAGAQHPEQQHRSEHDGGVDLRHHGPAEGHDQRRRDELVDRRAGVAGAVDAHRKALPVLREPARDVGRADRERAAGQADEQADHEEVPERRGVGHQPDRRHRARHQQRHHDAAAVLVGPDAERHADQRSGQHRRGRQQAELGGVEAQRLPDRDADHAEHHPHHEAHGECERADQQHRQRLTLLAHHTVCSLATNRL